MFNDEFEIPLEHGLTDTAGGQHLTARVRVPDGYAEQAIAGYAQAQVTARDESAVLGQSLSGIGGYGEVTPELAETLSQTDRDRLLFMLRAALMRGRIQITARCENPVCGTEVDIGIEQSELFPSESAGSFESGPVPLRALAGYDDAEADEIWPVLTPEGAWAELSRDERQELALTLARADPGVSKDIALTCLDCRLPIAIHLNPLELLARELALGAPRLLAEVHTLAFHYGWAEKDVLALPRARRWQYIAFITAQITGGSLTSDWR